MKRSKRYMVQIKVQGISWMTYTKTKTYSSAMQSAKALAEDKEYWKTPFVRIVDKADGSMSIVG